MKPVSMTPMQTRNAALLLFAATTALPIAAREDVKMPADLPAYGADNPLPVPKIVRQRLANGLQVWVVPRQSLPRLDFVLAVRDAGVTADGPSEGGFSNLLAKLLTEGSAQRDSKAIAQAAQGLGGEIAAASGNDGITLIANALASKAGPMMQLLAEVARQPAFADGEVQLAKANALQALKASNAQPGFRAEGALGKAIYGDHPYGNTQPTAAAIEATTPQALRSAHAQRFRPDRSLLVVVGCIAPTQALKLARAAFGDWQAQGDALPAPPPSPRSATPARVLLERPGSVQATLRLGRPAIAATDADYVPLRVTSGVIGEGFSSRVNINLREDKGYTYGASARARAFAGGGAIVGGADVRNEVAGASLKEFDAEYQRIGSEPVPAAELQMTKRYMAGSYLVRNQVQRTLAQTMAGNWLAGLPPEFLVEYVARLQRVTPEQVQAMGRKYYAPETQSIVVVGDKAAVAEQLKAWGDFKTP